MKIVINIDDDELKDKVKEVIAKEAIKQYSEARYGLKAGCQEAVKEMVYANKDELIKRCVDQASAELTRKGLPKLLEKY